MGKKIRKGGMGVVCGVCVCVCVCWWEGARGGNNQFNRGDVKEGREGAGYKGTWGRSFQVKEVQRSWNRSTPVNWKNNKEIRPTSAKIKPSSEPVALPQAG